MSEIQEPTAGPGQTQPWRAWWPPKATESLTDEELKAKPWIHWKPDPSVPNAKPWLQWVPRHAHGRGNARPQGSRNSPEPESPQKPLASSNAEGG